MIDTKRVIIVGNGAAAWTTAMCLNAIVNDGAFHPLQIAVVGDDKTLESPSWDVGLPDFRRMLSLARLDEAQFLKQCGGTFSHAIQLCDWGNNNSWYYTFDRHRVGPIDTAGSDWLKSDQSLAFAETVSVQPALCRSGIAPLPLPGQREYPQLKFGFHFDELRLADVYREVALANDVAHVVENAVEFECDQDGDVAALTTAAGNRIEGDIFVDCSGPEGRIFSHLLDVDRIDCQSTVISNSIAAIELPYEIASSKPVAPFTRVTSIDSGYLREIPLQDRLVRQLIYANSLTDRDAAERLLRGTAGAAFDGCVVNHTSCGGGYRTKAWVGNCVAIGSSFAAVDPVASAAVSLGLFGATMLAEHFPLFGDNETCAYRYNRLMASRHHEILDFTALHYVLSAREDAHWQAAANAALTNERLTAKLDFWKERPPAAPDFEDQWFLGGSTTSMPGQDPSGQHPTVTDTGSLYGQHGYEMMLFGAGYFSDACQSWYGAERPRSRVLESVAIQLQQVEKLLPSQESWLQTVCGMPDYNNS